MRMINALKALLTNNPDVAKLIVPSSRFEIYIDLNGDGIADFAFIDSSCDFTGNGVWDTFAIDLGSDGEFDLYLHSSNKEITPNEMVYLADGSNRALVSTGPELRDKCSEILTGISDGLVATLVKNYFSAEEFKTAIRGYVANLKARLPLLLAEYQKSQAAK